MLTRGNPEEGRRAEKSKGWRRRRQRWLKDSVVDFCGAQSLSGAVNLSAGSESKCPHHDAIHPAEWPVTHCALSPALTQSLRTHSGHKRAHLKPVTWPPSFQPRCFHAPHQRRGERESSLGGSPSRYGKSLGRFMREANRGAFLFSFFSTLHCFSMALSA